MNGPNHLYFFWFMYQSLSNNTESTPKKLNFCMLLKPNFRLVELRNSHKIGYGKFIKVNNTSNFFYYYTLLISTITF